MTRTFLMQVDAPMVRSHWLAPAVIAIAGMYFSAVISKNMKGAFISYCFIAESMF